MAGSIDRVTAAAAEAGLEIEVRRMGASTRTAEEAAAQCGCSAAQIVKSLVFSGEESGRLYLFLVPGTRRLDAAKAFAVTGEPLARAEPRQVRDLTGFAIGGVSPIGHLAPIPTFADRELLIHDQVWAAAGAHDAVFSVQPGAGPGRRPGIMRSVSPARPDDPGGRKIWSGPLPGQAKFDVCGSYASRTDFTECPPLSAPT